MTNKYDLTFSLKASELDTKGVEILIEASSEECSALAERFGIVSIDNLSANLTVKAKTEFDGVLVAGNIKASLAQTCTVSLQDVPEAIDEEFSLLLVSPEVANNMDDDEAYLDENAPEYDALESDIVEVGEVVAQTLGITMNQYPRAEGFEMSVSGNQNVSVNEGELEKPNPFADLAKLKDQS